MAPEFCRLENGSIGRIDKSSPAVFALLKNGVWLPAGEVNPRVTVGDFFEAAPLTESEVEAILAGQIPPTMAAPSNESTVKLNKAEKISLNVQTFDHLKRHRNGISTFLKVLGFIWMLGVAAFEVIGAFGVLIDKGLSEALYLFAPTNATSWLVVFLIASPGFALFALANWIEQRQKNL